MVAQSFRSPKGSGLPLEEASIQARARAQLFICTGAGCHNLFILWGRVTVRDTGLLTAALLGCSHLLIGGGRGSAGQSGERELREVEGALQSDSGSTSPAGPQDYLWIIPCLSVPRGLSLAMHSAPVYHDSGEVVSGATG